MPQRAEVDQVLSYAHRDGDEIRLVLHVRDRSVGSSGTTVELRRGRRRVQAPATVEDRPDGAVIEARARRRAVGRGVWRLSLRGQQATDVLPLRARLLVSSRQPVALLAGPRPKTELPAPRPRKHAPSPARRLAGAARRRAVRLVRSVRTRRAAT